MSRQQAHHTHTHTTDGYTYRRRAESVMGVGTGGDRLQLSQLGLQLSPSVAVYMQKADGLDLSPEWL